ncbi:MAG: 3-dehydroquinate synthase [Desulfopila sp.]
MKNGGEMMVGLGERTYPIRIEYGCLENIGDDLARRHIAHRYCVIADETVAALYADTLVRSLRQSGIAAELVTFPAGEASKNLGLFADLCSTLARKGYDRKDGIIALGGGVTGDLAGFVAAAYLRGIAFVQVPTTLLAQVDSSVGGKTGVDIAEGKNLVGAFYQPRAVYIDTAVLQTLADEEFGGGMAEVIKYGVIRDTRFFQYLRNERSAITSLDQKAIEYIIETCCRLKAEVVAEDEKESDVRRILNFGHTIGHAVEAVSDFTIIHGRAVAIGMVAAARIAVRKDLLSRHECDEIMQILREYDLPTEIPPEFDRNLIKNYLLTDKKSVAGKIAYILPRSIGEVCITDDVDDAIIDAVIA